jgi:hypothetical protein
VRVRRLSAALFIVFLTGPVAARQSTVPTTYNANTTRTPIVEPALPILGPAGTQFIDPAFGSRLVRVTDANTHPGLQGMSWTTASAAHQLEWNATSDRFWVRSISGAYVAYDFDGATMTATRITTTTSGGDGFIFSQTEPQFSFVAANVLYGTRQASTPIRPVVRRFDFNTMSYTDILDLGAITTLASPSYARALAGSASTPEMLSVLFGGAQQDLDFKVAAFQVASPVATVAVLDSVASTITRGGTVQPTTIPLGFSLHHQWLDLSGRYVVLYPVSGSFPSPLPYFIWDLHTDVVTRVNRFPGGHDALGYGWHVNQDCCTTTAYDGAQWQLRQLSDPVTTSDLINPVQTPPVPFIADHTSWNNAQAGIRVPILSSLYRYGSPPSSWRAWDDEIVAIQTDAGAAGATVWRFAQHRSAIASDVGGPSNYFWYLPRAVISPDGKFALFTSNWEKTLGASVTGEPGGDYRTDVFIVALVAPPFGGFTDDPLIPGVTVVKASHLAELRLRVDALRMRFGAGVYAWTDPGLPAGTTIKAVHVHQLRLALQQAYTAAGLPPPAYTEQAITVIKAAHIHELRSAVVSLEES